MTMDARGGPRVAPPPDRSRRMTTDATPASSRFEHFGFGVPWEEAAAARVVRPEPGGTGSAPAA